ncbi:flavodoxin domain-containing protein [Tractidigestivibacter scatoligenes]|jgi:flavodoxin I|uniref:flavodoxin domain-containing protein n=1 Tax=Tractidigestivibacter scatoligenes TaxID=1299998 RepID=UPI002F35D533
MSKVAVVYWTMGGNTEAMAKAVAKGAGVNVVETYIAHLEPDDDALAACEALGAKLAG